MEEKGKLEDLSVDVRKILMWILNDALTNGRDIV